MSKIAVTLTLVVYGVMGYRGMAAESAIDESGREGEKASRFAGPLADSYVRASELLKKHPHSLPPITQRVSMLTDFDAAFGSAHADIQRDVQLYVQSCVDVSGILLSYEIGPDRTRKALAHRMMYSCLPFSDVVPIPVAMSVLRRIDWQLDAEGNPVAESSRPEHRLRQVERMFALWRRIMSLVDPAWKEGDPNNVITTPRPKGGRYMPGIAPEGITEPDIRKEYEERLAQNNAKAVRNITQYRLRVNRDEWRTMMGIKITAMYARNVHISHEEGRMLRLLLHVYVHDAKVRAEVLAAASLPADEPNSR